MTLRLTALALFFGLACSYLALSPFAIAGMGYTAEEMKAGNAIIAHARPFPWSRNGLVPVLFDVPFLLLGDLHSDPGAWQDRYLALGPALATAGLLVILFVWLNAITGDRAWSFALALIAGFCTMLWPYAYIGLETKQSLALLMAAYLALAPGRRRGPFRTVIFIMAGAIAVSVKSTGLFIAPATAYLVFEYFSEGDFRRLLRAVGAGAVIAAVFLLNAYTRSLFWDKLGGAGSFLEYWMIRDPLSLGANAISFLASANKGLFVYAPVTLLGCAAALRLVRKREPVAIFALLTLGGLIFGFSLLTDWSDETWGPRYLHTAIAPLILCIAAAAPGVGRPRAWLAALAAAGLVVAFLGSFFAYGSLQSAATQAGQDTLEAYQGDIVWNHVRFNARLLGVWLRNGNGPPRPAPWIPEHHWFYERPADAPPWKAVDLGPIAYPQPVLARGWGVPRQGWFGLLWNWSVAFALAGPLLLACAGFLACYFEIRPPKTCFKPTPTSNRT